MESLTAKHPAYYRLREIPDPPDTLYAEGNPNVLIQRTIAIVGSRTASPYGIRSALTLAKRLAQAGFVIVSGLAKGIDAAAHRGCLMGGGKTVAFLGHGLDRIYPVGHYRLAREIVKRGGALVSEYEWGTPTQKYHFPERNRLISGVSLGTIVIEAGVKSGSLITAQLALEQNREVFVIPGPFDSPSYAGSHQLAQQGAKLICDVEDVIEEFVPLSNVVLEEGAEWPELRSLFFEQGGQLSIEALYRQPEASGLVHDLDAAMRAGVVAEILPQHYCWLGAIKQNPMVPCQSEHVSKE